jgi:hypothetical protein
MNCPFTTHNLYRLEGHAKYGRQSGTDLQGNGRVIFYDRLLRISQKNKEKIKLT